MAYNVRRNPATGYVALYNISRIKGSNQQKVLYISGYGVMSKVEFAKFRTYAHGITPQEKRLKILLSDSRCVESQKELPKKSMHKAESKQKTQARRGFKVPKQTSEDIKEDVERYKRNKQQIELTMSHTERMMIKREGKKHADIKAKRGLDLNKYKTNEAKKKAIDDRTKEIDTYIKHIDGDIRDASREFSISKHRLPIYRENRSKASEAKEILKEQRKGIKA